jgi:isocitrate dehydrogenase
MAGAMNANEEKIADELLSAQGGAVDLGGYYRPEVDKVAAAMRPSRTFNGILG